MKDDDDTRDWENARTALITLETLISDQRLSECLAALETGDEDHFVEVITSGEVWNHMGEASRV